MEEVIELMNAVVMSVSKPRDLFMTPAEMREDPIGSLFDVKEKVDAFKEAVEKIAAKKDDKKDNTKSEKKDQPGSALWTPEVLQLFKKLKKSVGTAAVATKTDMGALKKDDPSPGEKSTGKTDSNSDIDSVTREGASNQQPSKRKVRVDQWVARVAGATNWAYYMTKYSDGTVQYGSKYDVLERKIVPGSIPLPQDWKLLPRSKWKD